MLYIICGYHSDSDSFTPDHLSFCISVVGGDELAIKLKIPLGPSHLIMGAIFWPRTLSFRDVYENLLKSWIAGSCGVIQEGQQQLLANFDASNNSTFSLHSAIISFLKYLVASTGMVDIDCGTLLQVLCRAEAFSLFNSWVALGAIGHVAANFDSSNTGSLASLGLLRLLQIPQGAIDSLLSDSKALGGLHDMIPVHTGLKFLLERQLGTPFPLFSGVLPLMRRLKLVEPGDWGSVRHTTSIDLQFQHLCGWRDDMEAALQMTGEMPAQTLIVSIAAAAAVGNTLPEFLVISESEPVTDLQKCLEGAVTQVAVVIRGLAAKLQAVREERAVWEIALTVCHETLTQEDAIAR